MFRQASLLETIKIKNLAEKNDYKQTFAFPMIDFSFSRFLCHSFTCSTQTFATSGGPCCCQRLLTSSPCLMLCSHSCRALSHKVRPIFSLNSSRLTSAFFARSKDSPNPLLVWFFSDFNSRSNFRIADCFSSICAFNLQKILFVLFISGSQWVELKKILKICLDRQ